MLSGQSILLGVTGGIAAYKAAEVVSRLRKLGAEVDVIMTKNATEFVSPLTFETLSARPTVTDTFARPERWDVKHVSLARKATLCVVAPATANLMAKLAVGLADDMLTTTLLATRAPILLAPAMNTGMWEAAATQENLAKLKARGVRFVGPEGGRLACGDSGVGRMSEPEKIVSAVCQMLCRAQDMEGLRVLVTAGPTRERIDPVRYLTNDSSGKMGYALAQAALNRGAQVTLVSGPVALTAPSGAELVPVESTRDLYEAVLSRCESADVVIQAAAPADYRPEQASDRKLKKQNSAPLALTLCENPDVARAVGERKRPGQTLVGFAAETNDLLENARRKLASKHLDLLVANDVTQPGAGFGVDTNIVTLLTHSTETPCPLMSKAEVADRILEEVLALRRSKA